MRSSRLPAACSSFPGFPPSWQVGAEVSASHLGSRRAPDLQPPQTLGPRSSAGGRTPLPATDPHGRARGTRPDRRQAEHRRVAGQGEARAALACAPPGVSGLSYLRPTFRAPFKVLYGHFLTCLERHDSLLSSLSDKEISLGNQVSSARVRTCLEWIPHDLSFLGALSWGPI